MTKKAKNIWQFLELPNRYAPAAQALYLWGLNCDRDGNPFLVYLDLIGWTAENGFTAQALPNSSYGDWEISDLADALTEFVHNPHQVTVWINELMSMEGV